LPEMLLCVSMRVSFVATLIGEGLRPSPGLNPPPAHRPVRCTDLAL
jgi:hypothetical protein